MKKNIKYCKEMKRIIIIFVGLLIQIYISNKQESFISLGFCSDNIQIINTVYYMILIGISCILLILNIFLFISTKTLLSNMTYITNILFLIYLFISIILILKMSLILFEVKNYALLITINHALMIIFLSISPIVFLRLTILYKSNHDAIKLILFTIIIFIVSILNSEKSDNITIILAIIYFLNSKINFIKRGRNTNNEIFLFSSSERMFVVVYLVVKFINVDNIPFFNLGMLNDYCLNKRIYLGSIRVVIITILCTLLDSNLFKKIVSYLLRKYIYLSTPSYKYNISYKETTSELILKFNISQEYKIDNLDFLLLSLDPNKSLRFDKYFIESNSIKYSKKEIDSDSLSEKKLYNYNQINHDLIIIKLKESSKRYIKLVKNKSELEFKFIIDILDTINYNDRFKIFFAMPFKYEPFNLINFKFKTLKLKINKDLHYNIFDRYKFLIIIYDKNIKRTRYIYYNGSDTHRCKIDYRIYNNRIDIYNIDMGRSYEIIICIDQHDLKVNFFKKNILDICINYNPDFKIDLI